MPLFTPEDLLEYYYGETLPENFHSIDIFLENDIVLQREFSTICQLAERLDKSVYSPRLQSVQAVLDHAASYLPISAE